MGAAASARAAARRLGPTSSALSTIARPRITTTLPGSDGWRLNPPSEYQALAPFTSAPIISTPASRMIRPR